MAKENYTLILMPQDRYEAEVQLSPGQRNRPGAHIREEAGGGFQQLQLLGSGLLALPPKGKGRQ